MRRVLSVTAVVACVITLILWSFSWGTSSDASVPGAPSEVPDEQQANPARGDIPSDSERQPVAPAPLGEGVLTGRVVDAEGSAVRGASISLRLYPEDAFAGGQQSRVATDADGEFRFRFALACTVQSISAAPTATTTGARRWIDVRVRRGQERDVQLSVGAGARVRGRVVDDDNQPVAGAQVLGWRSGAHRIDGTYSRPPERTATTGDDGSFELAHLGPEFVLSAAAEAMLCRVRLHGRVDGRSAIDGVELVLGPSAEIEGRLLDDEGEPIAGHKFGNHFGGSQSERDNTEVAGVRRIRPEHNVTTTAADGSFHFTVVRDHKYRWEVQHPHHPMWRHNHSTADGFLEARLERGAELSGRVFAPDGTPAVGAVVVLNDHPDRRDETDAGGRFTLRGSSDRGDSAYLRVSLPGAAIHCVQPLPENRDDIRVQLVAGLPLGGRVVDSTGRPVYDALVTIDGDRQIDPGFSFGGEPTWEWAHGGPQTRTNVDGTFRFTDLYDGVFRVRVHDPVHSALSKVTEARSGAEKLVVRLDTAAMRGVVFKGTVRDSQTSAPICTFEVMVGRVEDNGWSGKTIDVDDDAGEFELPGYEAGRYVLQVCAPGYAQFELPANDFGVGEHQYDVRLDARRDVELSVVDAVGTPVRRARISVRDPISGEELTMIKTSTLSGTSTRTQQDGSATLRGLPARPLMLVIAPRGMEPVEQAMDLTTAPDGPLRVVVGAPPKAIDVSLVFIGHAKDADVSMFEEQPNPSWARQFHERDDIWPWRPAFRPRCRPNPVAC